MYIVSQVMFEMKIKLEGYSVGDLLIVIWDGMGYHFLCYCYFKSVYVKKHS